MRIGVIAGEASGDYLGAGLLAALRARPGVGEISAEGVTGPQLRAAGCRTLFDIDQLSLLGVAEVVRALPRVLRMRRALIAHFIAAAPDVVVGIDAPDFNLGVERALRAAGIPTVHYVSPTVWAWRSGRVRTIARSVDCMLTLFPFEQAVYRQAGVDVAWVGHPLADEIPLQLERPAGDTARRGDGHTIAVLPGSRSSELRYLAVPFARTVAWLHQRQPSLRFVAPMASAAAREVFAAALAEHAPSAAVRLVDGRSREVMANADAVLAACGTAALEAMLLKRPMVVAYRISGLTHALLRWLRLIKIDHYSLPNLLAAACPADSVPADRRSHLPVREFIQDEVDPAKMGAALRDLLGDAQARAPMLAEFERLHRLLRRGASERAATEVLRLAGHVRAPGVSC